MVSRRLNEEEVQALAGIGNSIANAQGRLEDLRRAINGQQNVDYEALLARTSELSQAVNALREQAQVLNTDVIEDERADAVEEEISQIVRALDEFSIERLNAQLGQAVNTSMAAIERHETAVKVIADAEQELNEATVSHNILSNVESEDRLTLAREHLEELRANVEPLLGDLQAQANAAEAAEKQINSQLTAARQAFRQQYPDANPGQPQQQAGANPGQPQQQAGANPGQPQQQAGANPGQQQQQAGANPGQQQQAAPAPVPVQPATTSEEEKEQRRVYAKTRENLEEFIVLSAHMQERTQRLLAEPSSNQLHQQLSTTISKLRTELEGYRTILQYARSDQHREIYSGFWKGWGTDAKIAPKLDQIEAALEHLTQADRNLEIRRGITQDDQKRAYYTCKRAKSRDVGINPANLERSIKDCLGMAPDGADEEEWERGREQREEQENPLTVLTGGQNNNPTQTRANVTTRVIPNELVLSRSFFSGIEQKRAKIAIVEKIGANHSEQTVYSQYGAQALESAPKQDLWEFALQLVKTGLVTAPKGPVSIESHWPLEAGKALAAAAAVLGVPFHGANKYTKNVAKDKKALEAYIQKSSEPEVKDRLTDSQLKRALEKTDTVGTYPKRPKTGH